MTLITTTIHHNHHVLKTNTAESDADDEFKTICTLLNLTTL